MLRDHWSTEGFSLFSYAGERKYLTQRERKLFLGALDVLKNEKDRLFCEMLLYTGCRPTEARQLTALQLDIGENMVIIRSLKKRGKNKGRKFRAVPVPPEFMQRLVRAFDLRAVQAAPDRGSSVRLWMFCRTTAWHRVHTVMNVAELNGIKACGRGLRHSFGVSAATSSVPQVCIQRWLGHEDIATAAVYIEMAAPEAHIVAARMWEGLAA